MAIGESLCCPRPNVLRASKEILNPEAFLVRCKRALARVLRKSIFCACTGLVLLMLPPFAIARENRKPNIVFILADDLGYGDVQCLNPRGKIPTPEMNRFAASGMIFTDAHATSALCSPSRYGILTGRYNWRSTLQRGVLWGRSKPLIAPDRLTVAELLKQNGYDTGCFGKWHLGMTLPNQPNWDRLIPDGPLTRGFDEYFGITASLDIPPYGFIHNDRFTAPLNTEKELAKGRRGAAQADFEAVNVLPAITAKAVDYVRQEAPKKKPFFLYFPLTSPHVPLAPTKEWQGKSGLGDYADFVMETDWAIGRVLAALDETGATSNTLVIVTSDNGCSPFIGVEDLEKHGHFPSAQFRGYKSDIWDGGHHEPFLVRWPGVVKPGTRSDAIICLSDFIATCADILGVKLPSNAAEDSMSFLATLRNPAKPAREIIVHHSGEGYFAIREGKWKLELCPGSGGWGKPSNTLAKKEQLPPVQLYDLSKDIGETNNVEAQHPHTVAKLTKMLKEQIADGRSTPGPKETNDVNVVILKPIPERELD